MVNAGCETETDANGAVVGKGCGGPNGKKYEADGTKPNEYDQINLRCFQQKRRFGVDYLYPVERYSRALREPIICPFEDDLDPKSCNDDEKLPNPLFTDLTLEDRQLADPAALPAPPRPQSLVFFAGILGVPWQDIAISPDPSDELVYRNAAGDAETAINWNWLIGDRNPPNGIPTPEDPLMIEQVEPRSGTNPATGELVADVSAGFLANSINGHEWNIADRSDLQYACIFPLAEPENCATPTEAFEQSMNGTAPVPNCDCTEFGKDAETEVDFNNPLCQAEDGSYSRTQRYAKAYPGLRQLQVLKDFGNNSIVASICPKESDRAKPDYGYRPAVATIVERLKEQLADKCLSRQLGVREDGSVPCIIVEAAPPNIATEAVCENVNSARASITEEVAAEVRRSFEASGQCGSEGTPPCESYRLCEIKQLLNSEDPTGLDTCLNNPDNSTGDGWCYIDPSKNVGNVALVEKCAETEKRKLRFVGDGTPANGTVTFVACAGAVFDQSTAGGETVANE
jgi:hypothetical protein